MLDRWNQYMLGLQVALASKDQGVSWVSAVAILQDTQDENIRYKVQTRFTDTPADMVIAYVKWKTGSGPKPEWFIKSGE